MASATAARFLIGDILGNNVAFPPRLANGKRLRSWFNQHIIAQGNHIIIEVNDKKVVDFVDEENTFPLQRLAARRNSPPTRQRNALARRKVLTGVVGQSRRGQTCKGWQSLLA
jgi:hypothetical protein